MFRAYIRLGFQDIHDKQINKYIHTYIYIHTHRVKSQKVPSVFFGGALP